MAALKLSLLWIGSALARQAGSAPARDLWRYGWGGPQKPAARAAHNSFDIHPQ